MSEVKNTGTALRRLFRSDGISSRSRSGSIVWQAFLILLFLSMSMASWAESAPLPLWNSTIGETVYNPITLQNTTVSGFIYDPASTGGAVSFVKLADGYDYLVKTAGQTFYNNATPPTAFYIDSINAGTFQATITSLGYTTTFTYDELDTTLQQQITQPTPLPSTPPTAPVVSGGAGGVSIVGVGAGGSNGSAGALFWPPTSGGNGDPGPTVNYSNYTNISTIDQIGIEAGSIGGSGGNGGNSYLSFWPGAAGGNGGAGGTVTVTNTNNPNITVATTGDNMYGIYAYSIGGQAGNGGSGYVAPGGGTGGHSSDGGAVTVDNYGTITTSGAGAYGIYALSESNNGGSGGDTWGLVGESGSGGYGGSGGTVSVTNEATGVIYTSGDYAHGIVAQSIGGSGGSSGTSGNLLLALVGSADNGGNGGIVTVTNNGHITTMGAHADGIVAQSIGGGGGIGGTSGGLIALGGSGSSGGFSSAVHVTNNSTGVIFTNGVSSDGILAQSIGGSGGGGSEAGGLVAIGGSGAVAGNGGAVIVENYGSIFTNGNGARGIVAQSIGGGGGDGGSSGGMIDIGGSGAGGGTGALVSITQGGVIETQGSDATGILAQSIGGGGGSGGTAIAAGAFASVAVGGEGGGGGAGGDVNVTLQGQAAGPASLISTSGDRSIGLFAQSVGGGGGAGGGTISASVGFGGDASIAVGGQGGSGGDGGVVTMTKGAGSSIIDTAGQDATGVMLQSVGGGGGNGGYAVAAAVAAGPVAAGLSVTVGGSGGSGGKGGNVTVGAFNGSGILTSTGFDGNIETTGDRSTGFLAESVGGGGGNGGLAVSASGSGSEFFSGSISVGLGGKGGSGGDGGTVQVGMQGNIMTEGEQSTGLLVQSVGGGGGNGGGSIAAELALSGDAAGTIGVSIGGEGGNGGQGGQVTAATRAGTISTSGDSSTGILVQSVGGGGGNGGYSIAAGGAIGGGSAGSVDVGLGGKGDGGGAGGAVTADLQSNVMTTGQNSSGILVQSVGGGGGNGGYDVAAGLDGSGVGSAAVSVGLGGKGAGGGAGGGVNASSIGTIVTMGDNSTGFVAQSIGGGGGNGGYNVSAALSGAGEASGSLAVGFGGSGAGGGNGGAVYAFKSGDVTTTGNSSGGILAQSVGGGGGNGGFDVSAGLAGSGTASGSVAVGLGGSGAGGGQGGQVAATTRAGTIRTSGDSSTGILVQSLGGGGGNGGYSIVAGIAISGDAGGAVNVGLGGSGGGGGNGGAATADLQSDVITSGQYSSGILVQSVGGGGGNGGFNVSAGLSAAGDASAAVTVGLGGSGAGGGAGGIVNAASTGTIVTVGDNSTGFVAQSIGGGGGNGGYNVSAGLSGSESASAAISVGLGGSGAGGGNGGIVNASSTGTINTFGDNSTGFVAQSIGGGGGNGGFNVSAGLSGAPSASGTVTVGLGGSGDGGGDGGAVHASTSDDVTTTGNSSGGILAQSLGGGGGNGGFDVSAGFSGAGAASVSMAVGLGGSGGGGGNGSTVNLTVNNNVTTNGTNASGIVAQSLGGGGGDGGMNVSAAISAAQKGSAALGFGLGGSAGTGGNADTVTSNVNGNIMTGYSNSVGLLAQSVGGGGGNGGINVSGDVSLSTKGSGAVGVGIGGFGGGGGAAGAVNSTFTGLVQTSGDYSAGILAQSLGGGGGNGGLNVTGALTASDMSGSLAVGIGGFGGNGGAGNSVASQVTGGVVTYGTHSDAIVAQSLGGGGGNGGLNVTGAFNLSKTGGGTLGVGLGGFGGDGGNAGNVSSTVTTSADNMIVTLGDHSSAVVAESIGGGGGNGGTDITGAVNLTGESGAAIGVGLGGFGGGGGNAGDVSLNVTGDVLTFGNDSNGLLAQSIGGGGGNGGTNVTGSLDISAGSGSGSKSVGASIGVGGFGGSGGTAGKVNVTFDGSIEANPTVPGGTGSHGIVAQSIGGGGGNGGIDVSSALSLTFNSSSNDAYGIMVGVGGFGGGGGNADTVDVTVTGGGFINAAGAGHSAILAQSAGGGGGNGGMNVSGGIVTDSPLIVGVGGFGANAGIGKAVTVTAAADLYDSGDSSKEQSSAGIMAQSLGGGGGNGGLNVSGGLAINKDSSVPSITVGIGGFGGAGAASGDVTVNDTGNIVTSGSWVHGIMAQSIAGGGGTGGMNVSGEVNWADSSNSGGKTDLSIVAGIGGNGGLGANAGNVSVTQNGTVMTTGDDARGVAAQSIGGGGGNGGMNVTGVFAKQSSPISLGIGGSGTGGGDGGSATISRGTSSLATGAVITNGVSAYAIEASSIGGGGGDAGMNFIAGVSLAGSDNTDAGFEAQIAIGGSGASGGNSGVANVTNFSDIVTYQDSSHGILAQSIGGGGGNANLNMAVTYEGKNKKNMGLNVAVGGGTGDGGNGAAVDVHQVGDIETFGSNSYGILAQSIGGGGGNTQTSMATSFNDGGKVGISLGREGGTGGSGSDVTLSSDGIVITHGDGSYGMLAQSLGNGGGNSSASSMSLGTPDGGEDSPPQSYSVSVGLQGGEGGSAGNVTLDAAGAVITNGVGAHAIFAQSVGGGGGNGGSASTLGYFTAPTAAVSLGGSGGFGGTGGIVNVTSSAYVHTSGNGSLGILAQSIGGGGGTGGEASSGGKVKDSTAFSATASVGGNGGSGMTSGDVTVDNTGIIITNGVSSYAILAQSIGGGGGISGVATENLYSFKSDTSGTTIAVAVGGSGGSGAVAGDVTVTNYGGIGTALANSVGIFAQSVGGGGGNASNVESVNQSVQGSSSGNSFSVAIGGTGGTGGAAGNVTVSNLTNSTAGSGTIITEGENAYGILAMSIGGGGGVGSTTKSNTKSIGTDTSTANSINLSLGGSGGDGGTGGNVVVTNDGSITTYGDKAHGIMAESIGGGGGIGGMSISGSMALGSTTSQAASGKTGVFSVGGIGGDGNSSGNVTVTNNGSIEVYGQKAYGIYAQSVGGGGGDGGMAMALSRDILANPQTALQSTLLNIGMGGFGGDGANSGNVVVNNTGSIISHGDDSYGIFAQSVGGGGGKMGYSITSPAWMAADLGISTLLGGGSKGTAGTVIINSTGTIQMLGNNSTAQLGQSINGGGGNVDLFLDFSQHAAQFAPDGSELPGTSETTMAKVTSLIKLGATAAENAIGSAISATQLGDLFTSGKQSLGSLMQSVGGGGGNTTSNVVVDSNANVNLELALGVTNSSNGSGGSVTQNRTGNVGTAGDQSTGSTVQSIGGGGGSLTVDVSRVPAPAEQATVPAPRISPSVNPTTATTAEQASVPVPRISPSVNPTTATTAEQASVPAPRISPSVNPTTVTTAEQATVPAPRIAPSVSPTTMTAAVLSTGPEPMIAPAVHSFTAMTPALATSTASLGAVNGTSSNGGNLNLTYAGDVSTTGAQAQGLMLQSIGGGGGSMTLTGLDSVQIAIGGTNGTSGNGGNITLSNIGNVTTYGPLSYGMVVQSIGGGGGAVFTDMDPSQIALTLNSGNSGNGGDIHIDQTGDVTVYGDRSIGVLVQSIGGGGGAVDNIFMGTAGGAGTGGAVFLNSVGNIIAPGADSIGIVAQSSGSNGGGDITVDISNASSLQQSIVYGGSGQGAGVSILGGADNQLNNDGIITTVQGIDGFAILGTTGSDHISNNGLVIGSVDLGTGANPFDNNANAIFDSGATVYLGQGNTLTNEGLLSPGAFQRVLRTRLNGNLVQTANAVYGVDLDLKNRITDRINATGTADVSGSVVINLIDPTTAPGYALPGTHNYILVSAAGGETHDGLTLQAQNTAVATYSLVYPGERDIDLNTVIDYSPAGLTENERSVGSAINRIQRAQTSPAFRPIATELFYIPNVETLRLVYDSLSGEGVSAVEQADFLSDKYFHTSIAHRVNYWVSGDPKDPSGYSLSGDKDLLYAQYIPNDSATDSASVPQQSPRNWRMWSSGYEGGSDYKGDSHVGAADTSQHGSGFNMGLDFQVSPSIIAGIAGGNSHFTFSVPDRDTSGSADAWHVGGYGALRYEHLYATADLAYDNFDNHESRQASIPGVSNNLNGEFNGYSVSGNFETGYKEQIKPFEITPFAGLQFASLNVDDFTETGAGGARELGLSYDSRTINSLQSHLGAQLKAKTDLPHGMALSGLVRADWAHEFDRDRSMKSSFISAPGFDFVIQGARPPADSLRSNVGINLALGKHLSLYGNFDYDYASAGYSYSGTGGLSITW